MGSGFSIRTVFLIGIFYLALALFYPLTGDTTTVQIENDHLSLEDSTTVISEQIDSIGQTLQTTDDSLKSSDTSDQSTERIPIFPATIVINCIPDSVSIVINGVSVGFAPNQTGGLYPGIYEIFFSKEGYESFKKRIDLKENETMVINETLVRQRGTVYIMSKPDDANIFINDSATGITPLFSQPLNPGTYSLRVEKKGFVPFAGNFSISPKQIDTVQVSLLPIRKPELTAAELKKKRKTFHSISIGSLSAICFIGGGVCNKIVKQKLKTEKEALARYQQAQLSESTYEQRYSDYVASTKSTDKYTKCRNVLYTFGVIGAVGFGVSLLF